MAVDTSTPEYARLTRLLGFLSSDRQNVLLLRDAMTLAVALGDWTRGQTLLGHIEREGIAEPTLQAQACHLCLMGGDYARAATFGREALAAGVDHPAVWHNAGLAAFYAGDYPTAAALLARLSAEEQCSVVVLLAHARSLYQQGQSEEAEPLAMRAIEAQGAPVEARGLLALLKYEHDDNLGALRLAREVLAADPDQLDALVACAGAHFELGDIEAARKVGLHATAVHPGCGRAWFGLGELQFNELDFGAAEQSLQSAVQHTPDHIGTWHLLAWVYILREQSGPARQALQAAYELDRRFADSHGGLAVVDVLDGAYDSARIGIRRALKLDPDCLSAQYAQLLLLRKAGRDEDAERLVRDVLDRPTPSGRTGKVLLQQWLATREGGNTRPSPDQH